MPAATIAIASTGFTGQLPMQTSKTLAFAKPRQASTRTVARVAGRGRA